MVEELRALLDGMVVPSRAEPGNLQYDLWRDHADAGRFVLEELYTDDAAVAAHHATPHFEKYSSRINELAERTFMMLDPIEVARGLTEDDEQMESPQIGGVNNG